MLDAHLARLDRVGDRVARAARAPRAGAGVLALRELVEGLASRPTRRALHAFPAPENAASNAICARAGFELLGEVDFEYPKGRLMRSNDWRRTLDSRPPETAP